MKPFHERTIDEWFEALRSDNASKSLVNELVSNCGLYNIEKEVFVYRGRLNLTSVTEDQFDSPSIEDQKNTYNRFQPKNVNCLYVTASEETAILEVLPSVSKLDDIIYVSELKIAKPLKMLNLINNIFFKGGGDETLWNYKPIFGPMFLNEDPTGITKVLEITRMLSQKAYENKIDGIMYPSRSKYLADLKRRGLSVYYNYVLYGSPIREGKLVFDEMALKKYQIGSF